MTLPTFGAPRPIGRRGAPYPIWVRDLKRKSGAYLILGEPDPEAAAEARGDCIALALWGRRCRLVGFSHTDLYRTLTRHFAAWDLPGALVYDRACVRVAISVCSPEEATELAREATTLFAPEDMAA